MSRLSRVHLATKELTHPRREAPLAYQYVLFKRERLEHADRMYVRAAVESLAPSREVPVPEEECIQRALFE